MKNNTRKLFFKNIGIVSCVLQFIISAVFCLQLFILDVLPTRWSVGIAVILILLCVITFFLQFKHLSGMFGKALSLVLAVSLFVGSSFLGDFNTTLRIMISDGNVIKENICVYIMADREIPSDSEASEFIYGNLSSSHSESANRIMDSLTEKFGNKPEISEYKTYRDLAGALYSGKVEAIILDDAFVSMITDIEEYKNFETDTKILYSEEFSITIEKPDQPSNVDKDALVIYITGNDQKGSVNGKGRSDVNILLIANLKTKEILMVNTPRDYYVNLLFDSGNVSPIPDKLTHSGIYGINVSMNTLESIYDIDIDYYFRVNFTGFQKIIDALGGVDVYVPINFTAKGEGTKFTKGYHTLNGKQALDFVRERKSFIDDDNRRGRAQMEVITSLLKKVTSPSVITGYSEIIDSVQRYFLTDIPSELISSLVKTQIQDGGEWHVTSASVVGYEGHEETYSMPGRILDVYLRNESSEIEAKEKIRKVLNGESLKEENND